MILASSSGFTKLALDKAQKFKISTPAHVTDQLANEIAAELGMKFMLAIRRPTSTFTARVPPSWAGRGVSLIDDLGGLNYQFFRADGSALVTAHEYEAAVLTGSADDGLGQAFQPEPITIQVENPTFDGERLHTRLSTANRDEDSQ